MPDTVIAVLVAVLGLPLFAAWWCFVLWVVSRLGWARLARHYRADHEPIEGVESGRSGRIRGARYNGSLKIAVTPEGLYLAVLWLFRAGHPPLRIPWSAVRRVDTRSFLWNRLLELEVDPGVTIHIPMTYEERVREATGRRPA